MKKRTIEQTGLIPRSILRTFERFRKQLLPGAEMLVIQEFRISRYQVIVSVRCLITLIVFLIAAILFIYLRSKKNKIRELKKDPRTGTFSDI